VPGLTRDTQLGKKIAKVQKVKGGRSNRGEIGADRHFVGKR